MSTRQGRCILEEIYGREGGFTVGPGFADKYHEIASPRPLPTAASLNKFERPEARRRAVCARACLT